MADEYAKVKSMLDDPAPEDDAAKQLPKSKGSLAGRILRKTASGAGKTAAAVTGSAANMGTRMLAGGMAVVQTVSATSIATVLSVALGIGVAANPGDDYSIQYRDDAFPENEYECLDEYAEAWKGVFGTINESPLAQQSSVVVKRLREINEWSKAYVEQKVPDALVCDDENCPYYGHVGCDNPDHKVRKADDGMNAYYDLGGKIDLANVMRIHDFFAEYGLTDVQIAAICGVMTVESRIDFTSVEGYNISGERYNLDPSAKTDKFGFKPWAEGLEGSPIQTPTCIHEIIANHYDGEDQPIDYAAYSSEYPSIHKLGIGLVGFTDGPGFYNNTFLRNYADELNDKVTLIQRLVEGSRGWREELRQRAADLYHYAYGAESDDKRGTANKYIEHVNEETLLILPQPDPNMSTGWRWKKGYEEYVKAEKALVKAIEKYNDLSSQYQAAANELRNTSWKYHSTSEAEVDTAYDIKFEKHSIEDMDKKTTDINTESRYVDVSNAEELKAVEPENPTDDIYIEYPKNPSGPKNHTDVQYPEANPIYEEQPKGALSQFSYTCHHPNPGAMPTPPTQPPSPNIPPPWYIPGPGGSMMIDPSWDVLREQIIAAYQQAMQQWAQAMQQYQQDMADYNAAQAAVAEAEAEHARVEALVNKANSLLASVQQAYAEEQVKKEEYFKTLKEFNESAFEHAKSVVNFYNALQDFYTASNFDMETRIRDAAFTKTSIFDETPFYTKAAYEYKFNELISGDSVDFRALFGELGTGDEASTGTGTGTDEENPKPTPQQLKLYYELWQNYAKYATNLPKNGKYINWWTPEVQLLYFVGGSYDAEKDQGLKIRDEYKNQSCSECSNGLPERDTTGKYYYDWMSSWKGDDYTGRDITTATKNFFHDMVSGGFDDGTLPMRTEYAYAYYYMFQYGSSYQQAINYASVGGEASKIMEEMISEGRWQVNTSNTLSDMAMPHNDKWKQYQKAEITRQWEIDTSTSMSTSILSTLSDKQNHSRVNLLTDIWNGCKYINVIENSTIANSAMYLVDNPLIYGDKNSKFYRMKYGTEENSAAKPVSSLYKVVYNTINERLKNKGKTAMSGEPDDGFNFVKTCILWSGMDAEFENINNIDDLHEYLKEATSSVWQDESEYQTDSDDEKKIGRGNSRIWEQRKLGPYYDENGKVYYRYKWYLVPRVLGERNIDTDLKWYDDMRNDDAERGFGEPDEDLDKWDIHKVDEHDTNNTPSIAKGEDVDGYKRKLNENGRTADWMRIDWECWDKGCEECGGKGGHGDTSLLCPGDLLVSDDKVCIWLGEDKVQSMFPLEKESDTKLVYAGGDQATKLKSMDDATGFEWSKPCADYIDHDTKCPTHGSLDDLPKEAKKEDPDSCNPYNPEGKWTVYRLITSNYTDEYRNAGIVFDITRDGEWELWYKYKYKGMAADSDTKRYLEETRKELDAVINTDYPRDR